MARALRIQFAGALYHVAGRGNERRAIFRDELDRRSFLELLGRSMRLYDVRLLCYVLMSNHKKFVAAVGHDEDLRKPYSKALEMLNIQD